MTGGEMRGLYVTTGRDESIICDKRERWTGYIQPRGRDYRVIFDSWER